MTKEAIRQQPSHVFVEIKKPLLVNDSCHEHRRPPVAICCWSLSKMSSTERFVVATMGIMTTGILVGALQEKIFHVQAMRKYSLFLTLYQFVIYTLMSFVEVGARGLTINRSQLPICTLVSLLMVGTMAFSNAALTHLNFPTQMIFKCCKLVPAMACRIICLGKKFNALECVAVILMTIGMVFFALVDASVLPSFSPIGIVLISLALLFDALLPNATEHALRNQKCTSSELLLYSYTIGSLLLAICLIGSGNMLPSVHYCLHNPLDTFGYGLIWSIASFLLISFTLALIESHGALTAVTVTTMRKGLSVVVSFVTFEKPFSIHYIWPSLIVVAGIYVNVLAKRKKNSSEEKRHAVIDQSSLTQTYKPCHTKPAQSV